MRIDASELPDDIVAMAGQAWTAHEVVILKDGQPWVKLVPHDAYNPPRRLGLLKGQYEVPDDFCDTPDDIIADFYR